MEKKNNFMLVMIVILSVSLLGTVSFIVYDKVIKKDEGTTTSAKTNNQTVSGINNDECVQNTIIDDKAYVIESYNKRASWSVPESLLQSEYDKYYVIINEAILPKLNINTDNASKFNAKIMNDYKDVTDLIDTKKSDRDWDYMSERRIDYNYFVNNDVILITVNKFEGTLRGSADDYIRGYYYDIKNDKELTVKEVCERFGITLDAINKKISSRYNASEKTQLTSFDQVVAVVQDISVKKFEIYFDEGPRYTSVSVDTVLKY